MMTTPLTASAPWSGGDALDVRNQGGAHPRPLWGVDTLAGFLGVPVKTVYEWRSSGSGPRGFRVGKYVRYREEDVMDWLDAQRAADAEGR